MGSLGILQWNTEKTDYYTDQVAKHCASSGIQVVRLSPLSCNFRTLTATGLRYDLSAGQWTKAVFPVPAFIYDRCFYPPGSKENKRVSEAAEQLKKHSVFLGSGLPNKWAVYRWLRKDSHIAGFLPPTQLLEEEAFSAYLNAFGTVVIKPVSGSGGDGFHVIRLKDFTISLYNKNKELLLAENSRETLYKFLKSSLPASKYIIQPFLKLQLNGRPFDLRVVMQKESPEHWYEAGKGYRVGRKNSYVSNLRAGGRISSSLNHHSGQYKQAEKTAEKISPLIPVVLEKYHQPLFELGIDYGLDSHGKLWIIEVNSKPGYETVLKTTDVARKNLIFSRPASLIRQLEQLRIKGPAAKAQPEDK